MTIPNFLKKVYLKLLSHSWVVFLTPLLKITIFLVFLLFLIFVVSPERIRAAQAGSPVAINGRLKVVGKQLTNQCGNPIQLRGMSSHGLQWYGWGGYADIDRACLTEESFNELVNNWDADIFRASLFPSRQAGGYVTDPQGFKAMMDRIIEEAYERGIYVIIDWHLFEVYDPWDVIDAAREFFSYMSAKHGNKGNVIYEICNEPNVSWSRIKSYAEDIIPRIRQNDPEGIIIVGTPDRSYDLDAPWANRLTGSNAYNVMYAYHWYLYGHDEVERADNRGQPVFISEWAATDSRGQNLSQSRGQAWIDLMRDRGLSWTAWTFADSGSLDVWQGGTCPNGPWGDANLTQWGRLAKNWIKNPADDFPSCVVPSSIPGDLNKDGIVNIFDLYIVGNSFGKGPSDTGYDSRADANNSGGKIDIFDLYVVGSNFGQGG